MGTRVCRTISLALLLFGSGCVAEMGSSVFVDLETDFVPELEFRVVETELILDRERATSSVLLQRTNPSFDPDAATTLIRIACPP